MTGTGGCKHFWSIPGSQTQGGRRQWRKRGIIVADASGPSPLPIGFCGSRSEGLGSQPTVDLTVGKVNRLSLAVASLIAAANALGSSALTPMARTSMLKL